MCVFVFMAVGILGDQRTTSGLYLRCHPPCFLETESVPWSLPSRLSSLSRESIAERVGEFLEASSVSKGLSLVHWPWDRILPQFSTLGISTLRVRFYCVNLGAKNSSRRYNVYPILLFTLSHSVPWVAIESITGFYLENSYTCKCTCALSAPFLGGR